MRKFCLCCFLILLPLLLIPSAAFPNHLFLSRYRQTLLNLESGMGANNAVDICQTEDGYIWIASYSGLLRYDGTSFTRFSDGTNGYTAQSARRLFIDRSGRLWIGTNDNGLFVMEESRFRRMTDSAHGAFNSVRAIAQDQKGDIYVGTSGGIAVVVNGGLERVALGGHDSESILDIACGAGGCVWAATRGGDILILRGGRLKKVITPNELGGYKARCLFYRSPGRMLAGLSSGNILSLRDEDDLTDAKFIATPKFENVNSLYEDAEGRLWVCSDSGIAFFDKNMRFNRVSGALLSDSVENIFQDYEGQFWLGSSRHGLLYLSKKIFMDVGFALLMPRSVVNAVLPVDEKLYIGTDDGLFIADPNYKLEENLLTAALRGKRVRNIMRDSNGNIWISTNSELGLVCLKKSGGTVRLGKYAGMPSENVRLTVELKNGDIAAGTNGGAAIIRGGNVVRSYGAKEGLANRMVLSICEDARNNIYLGTDGGGIFVIENDVIKRNITKGNGLDSNVILRMLYDDENGGVWVSTGNRIYFLTKEGWVHSINTPVPISSGVYDIKYCTHGKIMLISDSGIHITDRAELLSGGATKWKSFVRRDGLSGSVTPNSWNNFDSRGRFYLCCTEGLYSINPDAVRISNAPPKVAVNKITVDGKAYENPKTLRLPSSAKRLTIDLAVLSYANPDYDVGEYMLKGFDENSSTAGRQELRNVSYTNLPGGKYTFVFTAKNADGLECDKPVKVAISKQKTLSEEPLAILYLLLLGLFLFFLLMQRFSRGRWRALRRRYDELHGATAQAFTAIAGAVDAKDRYARGHSSRVAEYAAALGRALGLSEEALDKLYYAALLHDVGKMGIPDSILNKPGKLTPEEYNVMKSHAERGGIILRDVTLIDEIKSGAAFHHERYDGKGYGRGLKGEEIPYVARIICVADALDAMATKHAYRDAQDLPHIISEIESNAGSQFDPAIAAVAARLLKSGELTLVSDSYSGEPSPGAV